MHNADAEFDRWPAADWPSRGRGGGLGVGGLNRPSLAAWMTDCPDPKHTHTHTHTGRSMQVN